jgi:SAM-dependent methyltransferase
MSGLIEDDEPAAPDESVEDMIARALSLEAGSPEEAGRVYAKALLAAPANLEAHNALERLRAQERYSAWMLVNCVIDPRDDIFHFFAHEPLGRNPVREYLSDGWRTLSELLLLMDAVGQPLTTAGSVLEFAAGFGRFTRHLVRAIPGRVTVSDIHPGSVDFLREQLGVEGFYSAHDPQALAIPGRYDLVFVLSMFTHLPPAMWGPWMRKLFSAVRPGGHLVFTVHNESLAAHFSQEYGPDGTLFMASSESRELEGEKYGTTFATRAWVEAEVRRALGQPVSHFREAAFWHGQAAVVVRQPALTFARWAGSIRKALQNKH